MNASAQSFHSLSCPDMRSGLTVQTWGCGALLQARSGLFLVLAHLAALYRLELVADVAFPQAADFKYEILSGWKSGLSTRSKRPVDGRFGFLHRWGTDSATVAFTRFSN